MFKINTFVLKESNEILFIFPPWIMNLVIQQTEILFSLICVPRGLFFIPRFLNLKLLCLIIKIVHLSLTVHTESQ